MTAGEQQCESKPGGNAEDYLVGKLERLTPKLLGKPCTGEEREGQQYKPGKQNAEGEPLQADQRRQITQEGLQIPRAQAFFKDGKQQRVQRGDSEQPVSEHRNGQMRLE